MRRDDLVHRPAAGRVEWHELDEADADPAVAAVCREVDDLVVVHAADDDAVDLHRVEAGVERGVDTREDPLEVVAARERLERGAVEGIERDVHAAQAGRGEVVGELGEADAVRRHRQVHVERGEQLEQAREVGPHGRLAAGDTHGVEPEALDADPGHPGQLLVGQKLAGGRARPSPRRACSRCSGSCSDR